ncbi:hypothetical protein Fmac_000114 [Flemingia macrophylla]|uniref:Uncharacterized protein n=1 Tax=Flemingia macrophylla TaxID=520843 RepID=A0ABD1NDD2_9FABA
MAFIKTNMKSSQHNRSNSLPTAPHPLVSQVEEHLIRLKDSEATTSMSPSSISHRLNDLQYFQDSIDKLLQLTISQQALSQECTSKKIDKLLEGSLRLLDICSTVKDCLLQSKDSTHELLSVFRRRRDSETVFIIEGGKYLACRKKMKKAIGKALRDLKAIKNEFAVSSSNKDKDTFSMLSILKEAEGVTLSSLESLLTFIIGTKSQLEQSRWSVISKLMQPKRITCESDVSDINEFEMVDTRLKLLISSKPSSLENFQTHMQHLELRIGNIEVGVERFSRQLIRTRRMAATETNTKSSMHTRCNSLPSAPHPLMSQHEEHLRRLKDTQATSSMSSSSLCHKLNGLLQFHDCTDKLLQLPIKQQAFTRECSDKCVDDILEGSVRLLDICSTVKECLLISKESVHELHSVIRRRKGDETVFTTEGEKYLVSRNKLKKAIRKALRNLKATKSECAVYPSNKYGPMLSVLRLLTEPEEVTVQSKSIHDKSVTEKRDGEQGISTRLGLTSVIETD